MKMSKKGFTLIELLVVVLIIGILASIALPQYFKAVEKSKASEALSLFGSLSGAQQRYYLVNDHYTTNYTQLDLDFPNVSGASSNTVTTNNFTIVLSKTTEATAKATASRGKGRYTYALCKTFENNEVRCGSNDSMCASLGITTDSNCVAVAAN